MGDLKVSSQERDKLFNLKERVAPAPTVILGKLSARPAQRKGGGHRHKACRRVSIQPVSLERFRENPRAAPWRRASNFVPRVSVEDVPLQLGLVGEDTVAEIADPDLARLLGWGLVL